ncbi:palmitoyltransferase [Caerostris extrusa]|uniref:Palmitoyltransferase n=1 Tax=Caerostris extrusa TaxID=172846 RepID=A0AAV4PCU7_CAEEX|nr:palmitoyltransferase [Caerostris extrusa]
MMERGMRWKVTVSDAFSVAFLITAVLSVFYFEIFVVLYRVEGGYFPRPLHVLNAFFILSNILGNYIMVIMTDSSTQKIILPVLLKPMWHFCPVCQANAPPRAYHCDKCNCCLLKRDHHCTFAGCCIGLKNFRYFLVFLFYLSLGCFYATVFNMYFIWDYLGGFSLFSVISHIVPFVFWLFGYLCFQVFIYTMLSMLALVGFLFVGNLFVFHVQNMLRNQTTFEKNTGSCIYDLGWKQNIVECLGENYIRVFVCPLCVSPLPSDGISFVAHLNTPPPTLQPLKVARNNLRQRRS